MKNNAELDAQLQTAAGKEDQLLIETRINPRDIANIRPGKSDRL